jgi:hypothetical protein
MALVTAMRDTGHSPPEEVIGLNEIRTLKNRRVMGGEMQPNIRGF